MDIWYNAEFHEKLVVAISIKDLTFQKGKIPRLHQVKIPHMVLVSEASRYRCRPQRSERSEEAAAGVWGRSPQRGPGAELWPGG